TVEAQLERGEALREKALRGIGLGGGVPQGAGGGVGAHPMRQAAEELPAGCAEYLAGEVPEREIQRPAAPVVKVEVGQHAEVALERARVLTNEQRLVALEPA